MVSVAVTLGASQETAEKDMQEVHDFELQLANISSISGNINVTRYCINARYNLYYVISHLYHVIFH